jgi:hypothetical protein
MATERLINNVTPALGNPLHVFVFGSTLLVYNVHSLYKATRKKEHAAIIEHYIWGNRVLCIVGFVMVILSIKALPVNIIIGCAVLGFLSFAYTLPILPFKNRRSIRQYGWLKIIALTGIWTIVTSALPIVYWHRPLLGYPYEILLRFAFIFTLCIIFDLRDVRKDATDKIHTLPNSIGLRNSYRLLDASILLFVLLSVLQYMHYHVWERLAGAIATAIITHFTASYLRRNPSDKLYLLLGDGMMLVYAGFVFLLP